MPKGKQGKQHGLRWHPLNRVWVTIKQRCYNPKCIHYKNYGARGITMWSGWKDDFLNFYLWCIEEGWKKGLTIDRYPNNEDGSK